MLTGLAGVWLSIKEKVTAWPCFIACYTCYVYISFDFGLPALMGMNVVFIGLSLYGWGKWSRQIGSGAKVEVSRTALAFWPLVVGFIALGTVALGWLLARYGGAVYPYFDAFAACCGFTAQWMLGRKYMETWLFWIMSDLVYLALFAIGGSWPTVFLFAVFTVLAVKGWRDWKREFLLQPNATR